MESQFGNQGIIRRQGPYRELPVSVSSRAERRELYSRIPFDATMRGWKLMAVKEPHQALDPIVLYDNMDDILYEWPENYEPSLGEVYEVCFRLLKSR